MHIANHLSAMIKAVLVFNNHGKPRLMKFFEHFGEDVQQQAVREVFQIVSKRADSECNFIEGVSAELLGGGDYKLIYRHYATLYFVFCCDSNESELGILDLIQVLVESLDKCFENVCELDLIFHVDRVHHLVSEIVMGGMVLETNMMDILAHANQQQRIEKEDKGTTGLVVAGVASAPTRAVAAVHQVKAAVQQGLKN